MLTNPCGATSVRPISHSKSPLNRFVNQLLGQLEGVDLSDPRIKAAMENLGSKQSKDGEEKKDKEG
jgi:hypothetical protein